MENLTLRERVTTKSPKLFRKLGRAGAIAVVVGGSILGLASGGLAIPAMLITISTYAVAIGTTAKAISTLTVDEESLKEKRNEKENI